MYVHERPISADKLSVTHAIVATAMPLQSCATVIRIVCNLLFRHTLCTRNALTLLFQAVGLKSRKAGEGGEAGYGIPDGGCGDSEAVMKKVAVFPVGIGTGGQMQI